MKLVKFLSNPVWGFAAAAVLCAAICIATWWLSNEGARIAALLDERGVDATATVVHVQIGAGTEKRYATGMRPPTYFVTYRFVDEVGIPHEALSTGRQQALGNMKVGDSVPVRFVHGDPTISRLQIEPATQSANRGIWVMMILGVLAIFFGVAAVLTYMRRTWRWPI